MTDTPQLEKIVFSALENALTNDYPEILKDNPDVILVDLATYDKQVEELIGTEPDPELLTSVRDLIHEFQIERRTFLKG